MGRKDKLKSAEFDYDIDEEDQLKPSMVPISLSSDDEEANEDLSLKIIEKARLRASGNTSRKSKSVNEGGVTSIGAINLSSSPSPETEFVSNIKDEKKKRKKKEKKTTKKIQVQEDTVNVSAEAEKVDKCNGGTIDEISEVNNPVEKSDNVVLRKLLRGPRYFDPPDSSWGACYNCGEEGHTSVNCTSARRKKPCFVCGSLEHNAKQCTKGQDCFICKKGGHRAKDCPEKYTSSSDKICLKCGQSGHETFSCKNDYSPDDLKEIQCYMCNRFGHLCCVNYTGSLPREISCYRCGQLGHTGLACSGSYGETTSMGLISSCYRCGEEGHFARECTNLTKSSKRKLSTPTRSIRENREIFEARSAPNGKIRKRKKKQFEGEFATPQSKEWGVWDTAEDTDYRKSKPKSKRRGGWLTEDPVEDFPRRKGKSSSGWGSPSTPSNWSNNPSARKGYKLQYGSPASNSSRSYQHRFSASRFGNSSSDGARRNYEW